ncbi:MAG: hypothetical protein JW808_00275 [Victivallales bacterium]|nr:hypothetical protein [Victivallales bacterium]
MHASEGGGGGIPPLKMQHSIVTFAVAKSESDAEKKSVMEYLKLALMVCFRHCRAKKLVCEPFWSCAECHVVI